MIKKEFSLKIGIFGIGFEAYWEQFADLRERLESCLSIVVGF